MRKNQMTVTEPIENIRAVHKDCLSLKPDKKWLEYSSEWFVGKDVKIAFRHATEDRAEHMWVNVNEAQGNVLIGTLANQPIDSMHLEWGQLVVAAREQIEQVAERKEVS
jgi:uncharacterized protein YegJ (DUF2314 family)